MDNLSTGEGGKLHTRSSLGKVVIGEQECIEGEMTNETRQKLEDCKGKGAVVLEETTTNTPGTICESRTTHGAKKAVCIDECKTNKKCAQLCLDHGQAINTNYQLVRSTTKLEEIFPGTLFVNDSLNKHRYRLKNVMLYPELECQDAVEIQEDGSLQLKEKRSTGQVLHYGEFCIEPLDQDMERGKYRVKTTWVKEVKDEGLVEKEYYSVVLCISIVCLFVTIIIYGTFSALQSENKIMINLAGSLLLAFLSLVVMQNLGWEQQTQSTCTGLALFNQFAILSFFSIMTLMSYNICVQLNSQSGTVPGFSFKIALCYIIPGLITLATLIVELTAPRCASVRPKFGTRYENKKKVLLQYKPILAGAVTSMVVWTNFSGSIFQCLFSCSSTPACSSIL